MGIHCGNLINLPDAMPIEVEQKFQQSKQITLEGNLAITGNAPIIQGSPTFNDDNQLPDTVRKALSKRLNQ